MEEDFLEQFPTLEESNLSIEKLENFNLPKFNKFENQSIEEFKKEIFSIIHKEFKFQTSALQPQKCKDFKFNLFRVRELSSFTNVDIFSEHSYPPINLTKMGRCNFPKTPVFYCSNDPGTALLEIIRENNFKNKKYCISRWKVKSTEEYLFFENFLRKKLPKENLFKDLNANLFDQLDKTFEKKLSESQLKGTIKYLEFLDKCFIDDDNYSLSATLAHESLFRNHETRTDILAYPSRQTESKGVNFAINPNFVNNNMFVDRFYVIETNSISENKDKYNISFHNYGNVINRLIQWKKITKKDDVFEEFIKSDFGQSFYESIQTNND